MQQILGQDNHWPFDSGFFEVTEEHVGGGQLALIARKVRISDNYIDYLDHGVDLNVERAQHESIEKVMHQFDVSDVTKHPDNIFEVTV